MSSGIGDAASILDWALRSPQNGSPCEASGFLLPWGLYITTGMIQVDQGLRGQGLSI